MQERATPNFVLYDTIGAKVIVEFVFAGPSSDIDQVARRL